MVTTILNIFKMLDIIQSTQKAFKMHQNRS